MHKHLTATFVLTHEVYTYARLVDMHGGTELSYTVGGLHHTVTVGCSVDSKAALDDLIRSNPKWDVHLKESCKVLV